jgi:hypothetical protein
MPVVLPAASASKRIITIAIEITPIILPLLAHMLQAARLGQ